MNTSTKRRGISQGRSWSLGSGKGERQKKEWKKSYLWGLLWCHGDNGSWHHTGEANNHVKSSTGTALIPFITTIGRILAFQFRAWINNCEQDWCGEQGRKWQVLWQSGGGNRCAWALSAGDGGEATSNSLLSNYKPSIAFWFPGQVNKLQWQTLVCVGLWVINRYNVRHNFFAIGHGIPEPSQREQNGCIFRVHSIMSISISEASPHCPRMMMAKEQQIHFESRVRLLTVLHEAYQKKKPTQMDHKEHNSNWRC